jgi:hypothetical protein
MCPFAILQAIHFMQNQLRADEYLRRSETSQARRGTKSLDDDGLLQFGVFGFGLLEDEDGLAKMRSLSRSY